MLDLVSKQRPAEKQINKKVSASTVLMVPPKTFMFNAQTGKDNEFQHITGDADSVLRDKAMGEFTAMVENLRNCGVEVIEFDAYEQGEVLPDAVFPNNWLMTNSKGEVLLFPMLTENRRQEVKPEKLHKTLYAHRRMVSESVFVGGMTDNAVLEGTGAMVIDHANNRIFAALSERCDAQLLHDFAKQQQFDQVVCFSTHGASGKPIYHTNVLMSIGEDIAIICSTCITDDAERYTVLKALEKTHKVIDISYQQMAAHFCGNILQLQSRTGNKLWVMSESAYSGFTRDQRELLKSSGELVVNAIPTIENVGGGSCRCMLAEVFLPSQLDRI